MRPDESSVNNRIERVREKLKESLAVGMIGIVAARVKMPEWDLRHFANSHDCEICQTELTAIERYYQLSQPLQENPPVG